jgi:hypothetical protein
MKRTRRRWLIPLGAIALGAVMMIVGAVVHGAYASGVWLQLGAAVAAFGPLYWLQWLTEKGVTEVRRQAQETRSTVEQLSHEIEAIRQQTAASLDDLRNVALESVQERRRTDEDAFRRFKEEPTFENIAELIHRARELGAVSTRGVRVRLPDTTFRLRFPLPGRSDNGSSPVLEVGLEEEDATLPHDATAPRIAMRGQRPIQWSATQTAADWAASMAPELQRLNRYPGDEHFDPAGALEQLVSLLRLAIEARTRPPSATTPMPRLKPIIEMPNDEWVITEDGIQSLTSKTAFTVKELFDTACAEDAVAQLPTERADKLREAWRLAQGLFLSPGSATY